MKRSVILSLFLLTTFIPSFASAQVMVGPGAALNPLGMQPVKIGIVHEGSLVISSFTGDAADDFAAGGGIYYSALIRPAQNFAYGLHLGVSSMDDFDGTSTVEHGFVGGEGRFYLPIDPFIDLWASAALGIGFISESFVDADGYETEGDSFVKLTAAFGVGIDYYITPTISLGGYIRGYRMLYDDDGQNVEKTQEQITIEDYYGLWMNVGFTASIHY